MADTAGYAEFHCTIEPTIVGKPEFGWALASAYHGKRPSTEAVARIQAWDYQALNVGETSCTIASTNAASIHVAHKLGFQTVAESVYNYLPHLVLIRRQP